MANRGQRYLQCRPQYALAYLWRTALPLLLVLLPPSRLRGDGCCHSTWIGCPMQTLSRALRLPKFHHLQVLSYPLEVQYRLQTKSIPLSSTTMTLERDFGPEIKTYRIEWNKILIWGREKHQVKNHNWTVGPRDNISIIYGV